MPRFSELLKEMDDFDTKEELSRRLDWMESMAAAVGNSVKQSLAAISLPAGVPAGGVFIGMFDSGCPSGWTRVTALDSRFPRGAATYGGTGGGDTHGHTGVNSHDHGISDLQGGHNHTYTTYGGTSRNAVGIAAADGAVTGVTGGGGIHNHATGSGGSGISDADNTPPFLNVVFCLAP